MEVRSCERAEVWSSESPRGGFGPSPIFPLVPLQGRGDVSPGMGWRQPGPCVLNSSRCGDDVSPEHGVLFNEVVVESNDLTSRDPTDTRVRLVTQRRARRVARRPEMLGATEPWRRYCA